MVGEDVHKELKMMEIIFTLSPESLSKLDA